MAESAITILTRDHRTVEELFKRFETTTDRAEKTRGELVSQIIRELSLHASVEETVFYPRLREVGRQMKDDVLEGLEEHHVIKELLAELEHMDPTAERFGAKVKVLMENTRHHVEEEEGEMFPRARKALELDELRELGDAIEVARRTAPSRPHPDAPDEGPAGLTGTMAAGIDAAKDAGRAAIEASGRVVRETREAVTKGR